MDIFLLEDDEAIGIGLTYSLENEGIRLRLQKILSKQKKSLMKKYFRFIFSI